MRRSNSFIAGVSALLLVGGMATSNVASVSSAAAVPIVGSGFTVTTGDLAFILKQIKIGDRHSRAWQGIDPIVPPNPNPTGDPDYCQALLVPGADRGKLLGGLAANGIYPGSPDQQSGIGSWAAVKEQADEKLGLVLNDVDVTNVPMIATDAYGKFVPGPARGLPQYVTAGAVGQPNVLIEGDIAAPVAVPANVLHFDTPFLTDIAHNADPGAVGPCTTAIGVTPRVPTGCLSPDAYTTPSADFANQPAGTYDDEMLNAHFICGGGRRNENIALSSIHQVFHSEHNRLVDDIKNTLSTDTSPTGLSALADWKLATTTSPDGWNGERLFQAAGFVNEMEYQHTVFEEFARKVQPAVRPFHVYPPDIDPAIKAEFAHAVYRFGHSMLNDTVARTTN